MTAHIRAEQDMAEQMRGNTVKMAGAYFLKHFAEYFVYVEPNRSKDGKTTLTGEKLENEAIKDFMDHGEKTGHKIRVAMKDSSVGPKGRVAEFTLDYNNGVVNSHEEIFLLGTKRGIVSRPNQTSYVMTDFPEVGKEVKWVGKPEFLKAVKENEFLAREIIKRVRRQDVDAQVNGGVQSADEIVDEA